QPRSHCKGEEGGRPRRPAPPRRDHRGVGAERQEGAVGEVDDAQDSVDEQEPDGDDVQHPRRGDHVEELARVHRAAGRCAAGPLRARAGCYLRFGHWLPGSISPKLFSTLVLPSACTCARYTGRGAWCCLFICTAPRGPLNTMLGNTCATLS